MDNVTLKRGRGKLTLTKSQHLIAIRTDRQGLAAETLKLAPITAPAVETGTRLGGFEIVKVDADKAGMEETLDDLRKHHTVQAGTHVFHTPNSSAPFVPTGKVTLRFTPGVKDEQRQEILDQYHLEILETRQKDTLEGKVETLIVGVTPGSPNPLKVAEALQSLPIVAVAEPDLATPAKLHAFQLPNDTLMAQEWHLKNTGSQFGSTTGLKAGADARVADAWVRAQTLGATDCIVAVIDDGFDLSHPDLFRSGKIVAPFDFTTKSTDPSPKVFQPSEGDWHGTACAGVAVGNANGSGILGAAPGCRLMPVRWGESLSDSEIEDWFGHVTQQGAWVVSCSWGAAADEFVLSTRQEEAIHECATEGRNGLGCVIVFAAGNSNHDINDLAEGTVDGFAIHPDVIAVAASNSRDSKADYSNFGKEISICAPSSGAGGKGIVTTDVRGEYQFRGQTLPKGYAAGDFTTTFGGTSSATPLVAGICALILSIRPRLTAKEVKQLLERTARRIGNPETYNNGHSIFHGSGCVNADAAVAHLIAS